MAHYVSVSWAIQAGRMLPLHKNRIISIFSNCHKPPLDEACSFETVPALLTGIFAVIQLLQGDKPQ